MVREARRIQDGDEGVGEGEERGEEKGKEESLFSPHSLLTVFPPVSPSFYPLRTESAPQPEQAP